MNLFLVIMIVLIAGLIAILNLLRTQTKNQKTKAAKAKAKKRFRGTLILTILLSLITVAEKLIEYYEKRNDKKEQIRKEAKQDSAANFHDAKMDTGFKVITKDISASTGIINRNTDSNSREIIMTVKQQKTKLPVLVNNPFPAGNQNNNHIINGNNNQVGVNGDVFEGIKQRHTTKQEIDEIVKRIPQGVKILFNLNMLGGEETEKYGLEVAYELQKRGYKVLATPSYWQGPVTSQDNCVVTGMNKDSLIQIIVNPPKNVQ